MRPHHFVTSLFVVLLVACGGTVGASDSSPQKPDDPAPPQSHDATSGASERADAAPPGLVGGNCVYDTSEGVATITAIRTPGPLEYACTNDPRTVEFTFVADDPTAPPARAEWRLMLADGKAPPSACLTELGISVGATFRATRRLETAGTCAPLLYAVDVDLKSCKAQCDR